MAIQSQLQSVIERVSRILDKLIDLSQIGISEPGRLRNEHSPGRGINLGEGLVAIGADVQMVRMGPHIRGCDHHVGGNLLLKAEAPANLGGIHHLCGEGIVDQYQRIHNRS